MTANREPADGRRCRDCDDPIDDLPPHFKYCRPCFARRPESRPPPEDDGIRGGWMESGDIERMLTGID